MKIRAKDFRVPHGAGFQLNPTSTQITPLCNSKQDYREQLALAIANLSKQQNLLYASNRFAVLVIFQAMDAAGKDSVIQHVMSGINPQGCQVFSYKHPSAAELQHDFLWRTTRDLPERGHIGIFNRSYYEEVLITRVHPEILQSEGLPAHKPGKKSVWQERYRSIVQLERHLACNGTHILKFYLHLSKDEQRKRFLDRIEQPDKNWKFSAADIEERQHWKQYMKAYSSCLGATSTPRAPWYVVPADNKEDTWLIVAAILHETLASLAMDYPAMDAQRQQELQRCRDKLMER